MTRIKICGMTEPEVAVQTAQAGADLLGVVLAPSRRQLSPEKAGAIAEAVRGLSHPPLLVGVFVNYPVDEVNRIATYCGLDWVQLSGDETWEYCRGITYPILKTLHILKESTPGKVHQDITRGYQVLGRSRLICHLDSPVTDFYGGTGKRFDWKLAKEVARCFPIFVAGGLTPENVGRLVEDACPCGVDVSSGVETEGKKDLTKIREFIAAVRTAEKKE